MSGFFMICGDLNIQRTKGIWDELFSKPVCGKQHFHLANLAGLKSERTFT
jgi:hypothetical protein